MSLLITHGEEDEDGEFTIGSQLQEDLGELPEETTHAKISLNSVMGLTSPKTFKLEGTINEQKVVVMIDRGATHNFLSKEVIERVGVKISPSTTFSVLLGTWEEVQGKGIYLRVVLELQGVNIIENFLPLPLGNSDVILGVQWLEKLGTTTIN